MKLTLRELNERAWYRFLKVICAILYVAFFVSASLLVKEMSHEYQPAKLPQTATEAFQDENFYSLSPNQMVSVLRLIDDDFKGLPDSEQVKVIGKMNEIEKKHKKGEGVYVYEAIDTINIKKTIFLAIISFLLIVAFMEVIRRTFYYVFVGEFFPKRM